MTDWESAIDKLLRDAQQSEEWKNLPGEGRPLAMDNDRHTPADQRMAFKILKDNDMAPSWIMDGKELEAKREKIERQIENTRKSSSAPTQTLRDAVREFNNQILSYNLKVPPGITHKRFIDLDRLLSA